MHEEKTQSAICYTAIYRRCDPSLYIIYGSRTQLHSLLATLGPNNLTQRILNKMYSSLESIRPSLFMFQLVDLLYIKVYLISLNFNTRRNSL